MVVIEGVEPEKVKAALLPDNVSDVNDGVEDTVSAPDDMVRLVPVKSVMVSPDKAMEDSSAPPDTFNPADKLTPEVTVRDCPIPALPDTFKDEPIPTKEEKNPVPNTLKL